MIRKMITFFVLYIFLFSNYIVYAGVSLDENIFQDAINKNFKPIDKKAETFLSNLNRSKNFCFGVKKFKDYTQCLDYVEKIFSINSKELVTGETGYAKACEKSLVETLKKQKNGIPVTSARIVLSKEYAEGSCFELYKFKLGIFASVAKDILKKNKYAILKDQHKIFVQQIREAFNNLLDAFRVNIAYIERLWKKWPSKTKK